MCSSTVHSRPSSPKSLHPHSYTRIASTIRPASTVHSTQIMPAQCYSRPISAIARLLYTHVPPCPRKSSYPWSAPPWHHPFTTATPRTASVHEAQLAATLNHTIPDMLISSPCAYYRRLATRAALASLFRLARLSVTLPYKPRTPSNGTPLSMSVLVGSVSQPTGRPNVFAKPHDYTL